jgi:alpha-D-xyloside xylohydrolase
MKFTDGYWGLREGVTLHSPADVAEVRTDADSVTVYAPCKTVRSRNDTLNLPMLTLTLDSPMEDVIHVRLVHFKGGRKRLPEYGINRDAGIAPRIEESEEAVSLASGRISVRVKKRDGWGVDFLYDGRRLTGTGPKHSGYVIDADGKRYMREQLSLGVGESIYGLGERFTPFVKNGQVVDMWQEDGGTSSEQAYKNVPFFLSSAGYGVFVAHPERVSFEIASEVVARTQFSVPGEELEYYIVGGASPKAVLARYTELTGRPALPPAWSFGLWLTTSFVTSYDEATVTGFIDGMRDRQIPLHVFHFDSFWMKEFQWCDFEWDKEQFPDPLGFLRRLRDRGLQICVWLNPYIAQKSPLFDEGMEKGYLVKRPDGGVWQWDRWQAGMGLVDFTNPEATRWFTDRLHRLVKMGVSCFKSDFGERIPTDVVYHDGSDPWRMHNYYTYLYNEAVFGVLEEEYGTGQALVFARSATAGSQKFPVHWGGDCSATYESMAESLRGGLSLGLSGFGFWSHDISGFERTATPDLYKRWTAFGLLSSHSRLHGNESYRVPWLFDEEAGEVLRFFVRMKCSLMPYIYAAAREAVASGIPVMRAMILEFPDDPTSAFLDRQYMLGDSLLVAPVFNDAGTVTYYLPKGRWTNFITGESVDGGGWRTETHGYMSVPLMARAGSIIAVGRDETRPDYDYGDGVTFHVFEIEEGQTVSKALFDSLGRKECEIRVRYDGSSYAIEARGARKPWQLYLKNVRTVRSVDGGDFHPDAQGTVVRPRNPADALIVRLLGEA